MLNTPAHIIQSTHVYDCTISTCVLADWTFTRYHTLGKSEYAVVYGTVAQDGAGRFAAGSRIRTSPVTRWAAPLAHTHNSVYYLPEGAGCFCDLPATLQPAIDSLGIDPAEAAVILQNAFMQPAHALPETACFGVPVMRPAGPGRQSGRHGAPHRRIAVLFILAGQQHRFRPKPDRQTSCRISARLERILPSVCPYR